jgi:hypothetical protein
MCVCISGGLCLGIMMPESARQASAANSESLLLASAVSQLRNSSSVNLRIGVTANNVTQLSGTDSDGEFSGALSAVSTQPFDTLVIDYIGPDGTLEAAEETLSPKALSPTEAPVKVRIEEQATNVWSAPAGGTTGTTKHSRNISSSSTSIAVGSKVQQRASPPPTPLEVRAAKAAMVSRSRILIVT